MIKNVSEGIAKYAGYTAAQNYGNRAGEKEAAAGTADFSAPDKKEKGRFDSFSYSPCYGKYKTVKNVKGSGYLVNDAETGGSGEDTEKSCASFSARLQRAMSWKSEKPIGSEAA